MDTTHAETGNPRRLAGQGERLPSDSAPNVVACVGLAVLAACTSAQSQMETGAAMLPRSRRS